MISELRLFTRVTVAMAKAVVDNSDELTDTEGVTDLAMLTLYALRIKLGKSSRIAVDLLLEIPGTPAEIDLTHLPHDTILGTQFERIPTKTSRVFPNRASRNALATQLSVHRSIDTVL